MIEYKKNRKRDTDKETKSVVTNGKRENLRGQIKNGGTEKANGLGKHKKYDD